MAIWDIDCSRSAATSSAAEYLAHAREIFAHNDLLLAIHRHSAQYASSGKIAIRTQRKMRAPRPFSKLGAANRLRLPKSSAILLRGLGRYIKDAPQANFPKQAKGSIHGMASDFRRYTTFCEIRNAPPSPVLEKWRCGGVAFSITLLHSGITSLFRGCASFFPHFPTSCETPFAKHVATG